MYINQKMINRGVLPYNIYYFTVPTLDYTSEL